MRNSFTQATFMAAFASLTSALPEGRELAADPLQFEELFNGDGTFNCEKDTVTRTATYPALPISEEDCENYPKWTQLMYE